MSASQPPEVGYRRPAWAEPPADVVPGIVPVELILARTPQRAIGLTGVRAYPTGFGCTPHLRLGGGSHRRTAAVCPAVTVWPRPSAARWW